MKGKGFMMIKISTTGGNKVTLLMNQSEPRRPLEKTPQPVVVSLPICFTRPLKTFRVHRDGGWYQRF